MTEVHTGCVCVSWCVCVCVKESQESRLARISVQGLHPGHV